MVVLGEVFKCFGGGICSFLVWAYGGLSLGIVLSFFCLGQGNKGGYKVSLFVDHCSLPFVGRYKVGDEIRFEQCPSTYK